MKKSTIWLLTIVMALTFGALLYIQIIYLENMVKMRNEQFTEGVMHSLNATAVYLEQQETMYFLSKDISEIESSLYGEFDHAAVNDDSDVKYSIENTDGTVTNYTLTSKTTNRDNSLLKFPDATQDIASRYKKMHEVIRSQYLYQKGLLNEVILTILRESGSRKAIERADSAMIREKLTTELANNGLNVPYEFAVTDGGDKVIYSTSGYNLNDDEQMYSQRLFPQGQVSYMLDVKFPTKSRYIFSSVRFIIPSMAFTMILLVIFIYTIVTAFRQKKLTEMKTDFINNMTHELKTPISTISLAAQMLEDDSVRKSPASLKHISDVISFESKRLRFQVEKVLQLSVLDKAVSAIKFSDVDANKVIYNVVNTFKIKVEKYGGKLECNLHAAEAEVRVDEMQFTNVIFSLLDNAVKYRREDVEPLLEITTKDVSHHRLEIRVKDNGIGIKREYLKHIFEKFYRVPTGNVHDVKGFGLGLAYVQRMVTTFNGTISVESEYGVGTTFIIRLPLASADIDEE